MPAFGDIVNKVRLGLLAVEGANKTPPNEDKADGNSDSRPNLAESAATFDHYADGLLQRISLTEKFQFSLKTDRQWDLLLITALATAVAGAWVAPGVRDVIALYIALVGVPLCYLLWVTRASQANQTFLAAAPDYGSGAVLLAAAAALASSPAHAGLTICLTLIMSLISFCTLHMMLQD